MNEPAQDDGDPFHWDPQRLAQELCYPSQPWFPKNPQRFPSLETLSKGLQENDVDGEVFLTWDTVAFLQELFSSIGVNHAHHRLNLHKAIATLKQRSPAYLRWKAEENAGASADTLAPDAFPASSAAPLPASDALPLQANHGAPYPSPRAEINTALDEDVPAGDADTGPEQPEPTSHSTPGHFGTELADEASLQPPAKKRKVAPVAVSSDSVVRSGLFHLPTEADAIEKRFSRPQRERQQPLNASGNHAAAYIGPDPIRYEDIVSNVSSAESTADGSLSLGHKLRVNRAMKALLRGNKRRVKTMLDTFDTPVDPDSLLANIVDPGKDLGPHLSDDDSVFAPFGQESGDDEVDSQTAREMEDEAAEIEREKSRRRSLTKDEVSEGIDNAICSMVDDWRDRKLPALERKAHRIWTQARQNRSLRHQLRSSTGFLERLQDRIAKARQEIVNNSWESRQDVLRQAKSLEQSLSDQEHHSWLVETLNGPMPPKPAPIPRSPKTKRNPRLDGEDEVLTSESDDSMDEFIVDDEGGGVEENSDDEMIDVPPSTAIPAARCSPFKADPTPEPPSEFQGQNIIDLTFDSPEPDFLPDPSLPPAQKTGLVDEKPAESDVETVSERSDEGAEAEPQKRKRTYVPDSVWQSVPTDIELVDDERRIIERFWRIGKVARDGVYNAAKDCEEDESRFWDSQIMKGLEKKTPLEDTSAMIARLFLYYAQPSTTFHEAVFNKVRRKNRHKVTDKKDCASRFLALILRVMPTFPATVELRALPGGEDGETAQIIIDSRALNLRQRDQERVAAEERRRMELREKLALVQSIPKDESRLIVNETKEEDEGLIYIRGDPARLIKDHQIEGVRFLWNRVIANRDVVRHGCVLAHSMGLGKSMQVITFLLAVNHASNSPDESIRSQVPEDLRKSRTLILFPASLSQNWRDELLSWDSQQELGPVYVVASTQKNLTAAQNKAFRREDVCQWAEGGGVLILGYELFVAFTTNEPDLAEIIASKAAIVIADEAHTIKNPFSKRRRACAKISTPARIALTGSPLANKVVEYYSMVDWVAPQYMGSLEEFKEAYATPIENGLYKDPDPVMKRRAYVRLRVVRETMAPKVHRCGISILKEELQPKQEFMLFLPMTDIQRKIYDAYVENIGVTGRANIWGALGNLTLVCMHPECFKAKVDAILQGDYRDSDQAMDGEVQKERGVQAKTTGDITMPDEVAEKMNDLLSSIDDISNINHSWRFRLLFAILDECHAVGDKVLIFSRRQITLNFLQKTFRQQGRSSLRLDGKTPMLKRLGMIKKFNSEDSGPEIFLISTRAGGVGLNIHGANRVIIMDFEHNPMDEQQAIGRAYRIGQDKPVFVYWFVSWGTHEAKLQSRLVYKKQLADRVVEGKDYVPWAAEDNYESWVQNVWDTSPQRPLPPSEAGNLVGADRVVEHLINDLELSQGIKSIVTTDTFEVEEDPEDVKLTEEEENERRSRVRQERQRRNEEPASSPPPPPVTQAPVAPVAPTPVAEMPQGPSLPQSVCTCATFELKGQSPALTRIANSTIF